VPSEPHHIRLSRTIQRDARDAFRVVEEIEQFPNFIPNVTQITILENSKERKVAEWVTSLDGTPLVWVEEGIYDHEKLEVKFRAVDGIFDRFDGTWRVIKLESGCTIEFELTYELGLPEIEDLIAPLLRERLIENAEVMLGAVADRTESSK
jgi:ribosome-associated toxin RatA of RatAB toxin-antitoxin module